MQRLTIPMHNLRLSALSLCSGAATCTMMQPSAIFTHYGFSYYGNFKATLIPFCLGMVVAAYFLFRAALGLRQAGVAQIRRLKSGLETMSLSMFGIVITPSLSTFVLVQYVHVLFGTIIFLGATFLSLRDMVWVRRELTDWLLVGTLVASIIMICLSFELLGVLEMMLPGQLMGAFAFGLLLARSLRYRVVSAA